MTHGAGPKKWDVDGLEYIDYVSATDLVRRTEWRQLLTDASKRKIDILLVWRCGVR